VEFKAEINEALPMCVTSCDYPSSLPWEVLLAGCCTQVALLHFIFYDLISVLDLRSLKARNEQVEGPLVLLFDTTTIVISSESRCSRAQFFIAFGRLLVGKDAQVS